MLVMTDKGVQRLLQDSANAGPQKRASVMIGTSTMCSKVPSPDGGTAAETTPEMLTFYYRRASIRALALTVKRCACLSS